MDSGFVFAVLHGAPNAGMITHQEVHDFMNFNGNDLFLGTSL